MLNENQERIIKEKLKKYMNDIKLPENLEDIVMEDINKIKNENNENKKLKDNKTKKIIGTVASVLVVVGVVSAVGIKSGWFHSIENITVDKGNRITVNQKTDGKEILGEMNINIKNNDLYAVGYGHMALIQNGKVYFLKPSKLGDSIDYTMKFKEVSGIDNAISISAHNLSSSVDPIYFVTTEDGNLYKVGQDGNASVVFENYKIAKVESVEGEWNHEYVFILKDNRKIKLTEKYESGNSTNIIENVEELGYYSQINLTGNKGNIQGGTDLKCEGAINNAAFVINGSAYTVKIVRMNNSSEIQLEVTKVDGLLGVKSVKCYMLGTDVTSSFFAITNSGKVYQLMGKEAYEVEYMKGYEVDNISNVKKVGSDDNGMPVSELTLKLKDGSTATVYNRSAINSGNGESTISESEKNTIIEFLNGVGSNGFIAYENIYSNISDCNLQEVFFQGVGGGIDINGEEAQAYLKYKNMRELPAGDIFKVTTTDAQRIYLKNTGKNISKEELIRRMDVYLEKYDSFYLVRSDTHYCPIKTIKGAINSSGEYVLDIYISFDNEEKYLSTVTLKKNENNYIFISNIKK